MAADGEKQMAVDIPPDTKTQNARAETCLVP